MLLGTQESSLLRNLLSAKGVIRAGDSVIRIGNEIKNKGF